jgi:NAD+ diphosphatase
METDIHFSPLALTRALPFLPLAQGDIDYQVDRRGEPGLMEQLLVDPATKVVLTRGGLVAVPRGQGELVDYESVKMRLATLPGAYVAAELRRYPEAVAMFLGSYGGARGECVVAVDISRVPEAGTAAQGGMRSAAQGAMRASAQSAAQSASQAAVRPTSQTATGGISALSISQNSGLGAGRNGASNTGARFGSGAGNGVAGGAANGAGVGGVGSVGGVLGSQDAGTVDGAMGAMGAMGAAGPSGAFGVPDSAGMGADDAFDESVGGPAEQSHPKPTLLQQSVTRFDWVDLRGFAPHANAREAGQATSAVTLSIWHSRQRFCPTCGAPVAPELAGWAQRCTNEADGNRVLFPRVEPAVITSVVDGHDRLLLQHNAAWKDARLFSVSAGFVEAGENLEHACRREAREETGIELGEVRYLGSQPWPFPASLMMAFKAHAMTTDVHVDGSETMTARWVTRDEYTAELIAGRMVAPGKATIARYMIEEWLGREL